MAPSLHDRTERSGLRSTQSRRHNRRRVAGLWIRLGRDAPTVILALLVLLLPLLTVLALGPRGYRAGAALVDLGAAGLLLFALWQWRGGAAWAEARRGPLPWLLGPVIWSALSAACAPDKRFAVMGLLQIGAGVAVCVGAAFLRDRRLKTLVDAWIGAALLAALLSVTAMTLNHNGDALTSTHSHKVLSGTTHLVRTRTPTETAQTVGPSAGGGTGDPRLAEAFFVLTLPLLIALAVLPGSPARRLLAGLAMALGLAALVLTRSLGAALPGLLTSLLLLVALRLGDLRGFLRRWEQMRPAGHPRRRSQRRPRSHRTPPGPVARAGALTQEAITRLPLLSMVTAAIVLVTLTWAVARDWRGGSLPRATPPESAARLAGREATEAAVRRAAARPLLGWGPASFPLRDGGDAADVRARGAGMGNESPNFYAQTAAEIGLPGLLFWLGAVGVVCVTAGSALRGLARDGLRRPVLTGGLAAVGGWAVDAAANPAWEYGQAQFFLWLTLGMMLACAARRASGAEDTLPATPARHHRLIWLLLVLLGGGLLALIARVLPILPRA